PPPTTNTPNLHSLTITPNPPLSPPTFTCPPRPGVPWRRHGFGEETTRGRGTGRERGRRAIGRHANAAGWLSLSLRLGSGFVPGVGGAIFPLSPHPTSHCPGGNDSNGIISTQAVAVCHVVPNSHRGVSALSNVTGLIRIQAKRQNGTEVRLDLSGFPGDQGAHGIHVHEFGDLSDGCESLGGHFNPHHRQHGSHAGDLGNFRPGPDGSLHETLTGVRLQLKGAHSIIGRSIVVHENEDDMGVLEVVGSRDHGNAGRRLACCIIGHGNSRHWPSEPPTPSGSWVSEARLSEFPIWGRVHENEDDMGVLEVVGSRDHGNAGRRLACCVIGHGNSRHWPSEPPTGV
ncbi:uncharacterized protein LOC132813890, partial [Hemiscyllium ocellatum]|uniref:uncharacterized protein LOC132813890 n=1 Tax=Hemiscyllium ocellatum TaxID=170820 RepID=UPI002966C52E